MYQVLSLSLVDHNTVFVLIAHIASESVYETSIDW